MGQVLLSSTWYGADTTEQRMVWGGYYAHLPDMFAQGGGPSGA